MRLASGSEKLRAAFSSLGPWSCSAGCFRSFSSKPTIAAAPEEEEEKGERGQFGFASFWIPRGKAWTNKDRTTTTTTTTTTATAVAAAARRERLVQHGALLTATGGSYGVSYMR